MLSSSYLVVSLVLAAGSLLVLSGNDHRVLAFSAAAGTERRGNKVSSSRIIPPSFSLASSSTNAIEGDETQASSSSSPTPTPPQPLQDHEIAGCFGRLADKEYVVAPQEVTGTAASGYEFGVLQSGRPKWLCTYRERSGKTQGGGAEMSHVPKWRSLLFPSSDGGGEDAGEEGLTRSDLAEILGDAPFEMPLGPTSGLKQKAAEMRIDDEADAIVSALWKLLGGGDGEGVDRVAADVVSASLERAAAEYGSNKDSMTYAAFKKAMDGQSLD